MILAGAAIATLASCDPTGTENYYVNNNTDTRLLVQTVGGTTFDLEPHAEINVGYRSGVGVGDNKSSTDYTATDLKMITRAADSAVCIKDFGTYGNWKSDKVGKHARTYIFYVNAGDFNK